MRHYTLQQLPGRTAIIDGITYLFFSGFSYLGISTTPQYHERLYEGIQRYGSIYPSSRIGNVKLGLFEELEQALSGLTGMADTATFASGYLAAQAAVSCVARNHVLIHAPGAHPSLRLPASLLPEADNDDWVTATVDRVNTGAPNTYAIVMESVNPLMGTVTDFGWLTKLKRPAVVLIDDSHGIGILGKKGEGIISSLPVTEGVSYIFCYSLAKAFSTGGGAVSGAAGFIATLREQPFFTAATALSPGSAYAWLQCRALFEERRRQLLQNILYLREKTVALPFLSNDPRLPVFYSADHWLYEHGLRQHILLSSFSYPSEKDPPVTRVVVNALHTREDLDRLAACMETLPAPGRVS